eukprot:scaffold123688_cov44-Prasinocladus_malaysianus.AAC.2
MSHLTPSHHTSSLSMGEYQEGGQEEQRPAGAGAAACQGQGEGQGEGAQGERQDGQDQPQAAGRQDRGRPEGRPGVACGVLCIGCGGRGVQDVEQEGPHDKRHGRVPPGPSPGWAEVHSGIAVTKRRLDCGCRG